MRKNHSGFVMLILMTYFPMFALLSLAGSSQLALISKQIRLQRQYDAMQDTALAILKQLENMTKVGCNQGYYSYRFLQKQTKRWWQDHACVGLYQQELYYYLVEDIGVDNCALVDDKAAHYYRHTLFYPHGYTLILQDVIALPDAVIEACKDKKRYIKSGRQSLRWLS